MSAPQNNNISTFQMNLKNLKETLIRQIEDAKIAALQRIDDMRFEFNGDNFVKLETSSAMSCKVSSCSSSSRNSRITDEMPLKHPDERTVECSSVLPPNASALLSHQSITGDATNDTQNIIQSAPNGSQNPVSILSHFSKTVINSIAQHDAEKVAKTSTPDSAITLDKTDTVPTLISHNELFISSSAEQQDSELIDELLEKEIDSSLVKSSDTAPSQHISPPRNSLVADSNIGSKSNEQKSDLPSRQVKQSSPQNNAVINSPQPSLIEGNQQSELNLTSPTTTESSTGYSSEQHMPFGYNKCLMIYIKCFSSGCDELFISRNDVKNHMKVVHETEPYKCHLKGCSFEAFQRCKFLKKHYKDHHANVDEWICAECFKNSQKQKCFSSADKLDEHVRDVHENVGMFLCVVEGCEKTFAQSRHAFDHFYNKHNTFDSKRKLHLLKDGVIIRKEAIKTSKSPEEMSKEDQLMTESERHKMIAMIKTISVKCAVEGCNYNLENDAALKQHLLDEHQLKTFRCSAYGCKKSFDTGDELINHCEYYHPYLNWDCSRCQRKLSSSYELNIHSYLCREKGEFSCNFSKAEVKCSKEPFDYRYQVIQHYVQEHVGQN